MWFSTHATWFEGASLRTPSTNNALESFNALIKNEHTLRERLPLGRFFELCLESVEKWSKEYLLEDRKFITRPSIDLSLWTASYHWAKSNKIINEIDQIVNFEYHCPAGESIQATKEEIQSVIEMRWNTMDQFKKRAFAVWIVELQKSDDWQDGTCTCPIFLKRFICKHIVGLAIRSKRVKPPSAAKQIPIGQKPSRGRPKQAKKALLVN